MIVEIVLGTSIFGIGHALYRKFSAKYRVAAAELLDEYMDVSIREDFKVYDQKLIDQERFFAIAEEFLPLTKRLYTCSQCGEPGHNVRTCNVILREGEE